MQVMYTYRFPTVLFIETVKNSILFERSGFVFCVNLTIQNTVLERIHIPSGSSNSYTLGNNITTLTVK
jgi:hypothetical protein